ncbi:MAG TPA: hypothetical protein ENJ95_15235 [Bacteroidetes bacterium]|nr:hypothetical protein [Bacteroidota bacterium]
MNTAKEICGFDDKWMMIIGIPVVSFLMAALMFGDVMVEDFPLFIRSCFLISVAYTVIYWIFFRYLIFYFRRQFPDNKDTVRRLVYQTIAVVVGYFGLKIFISPLLHSIFGDELSYDIRHKIGMSISSLLVAFLVLGIYETIAFYNQLQNSLLEKERLMKENMQSQLEGLKNQVNPHFFFNSLNTLAYLIPEDPKKAENFVQKLSKAYRYILEIRERELVPLAEELRFLDAYNCLLKERFGNNLNIQINVPDIFLNRKVVPLSLQMLFENAIKHNIVSSHDPLTIEVSAQEGSLVIKNNLQRKNQVMNSTKIGLENIKRRYRLATGKEVEIIVTQETFTVVLPLVKEKKEVRNALTA